MASRKKKTAKKKTASKKKTTAKKSSAPKKKVGAKKKTAKTRAKVKRRDATGHLDPKYAADLRRKSKENQDNGDDARAFLKRARSKDDFAEELGEEAVIAMTSGEDQGEDRLNEFVEEEIGGPFVPSPARREFARGTDKSNPKRATREPFPRT